jgi:hypothetical protein
VKRRLTKSRIAVRELYGCGIKPHNEIVGSRVWLWPNLLSLDAPLVALLWQTLFIRCFRVSGRVLPPFLLVSAVWLIYAADRALDAWRGTGARPRHEFYRRHWRAVLPIWISVLAVAGWVAWTWLPAQLLDRGAWLAAAVGAYFAVVHCSRLRWPKEAAVAVIFGLGASLAAWTGVETSYDVFTVILFACLCWINCAAISEWEQGSGHWPIGMLAACVGLAALAVLHRERPILAGAEASSAAAFVLLDCGRLKLSADALRVLADVALLSPIFFLPFAGLRLLN